MKQAILAAGVAALLLAGGCGGGGGDDPAVKAPPPPAPGANVDPSSNNVITGPINQAKKVAGQQEQRDRELDQTTATGG